MTKKIRQSNVELLRIITMILVMIVHANFRALSAPTVADTVSAPSSAFLRFLTESFSIICVNVFVLISGWFGIHFNWRRFIEFLFQVFFFGIIIYAVICLVDPHKIRLIKNVFMTNAWNYWFVKCYLFLYIISPILNAFVEKATKKEFLTILILFFIIQTFYGWATNGITWFNRGYSGISFAGLYLLARYVRLYPAKWFCHSLKFDLLVYLVFVAVNTVCAFFFTRTGHAPISTRLFLYTSPFVILAAVHFLLLFTKFTFTSKTINWIAASCFAIYLTHSNSFLAGPCYDHIIRNWFNTETTLNFIFYTGILMFCVFWISILSDKIRLYIFNKVYNSFCPQIDTNNHE